MVTLLFMLLPINRAEVSLMYVCAMISHFNIIMYHYSPAVNCDCVLFIPTNFLGHSIRLTVFIVM